jgi:copper resistance protein B
MKRALIFLSGVSALGFAVPVAAQHDHAGHQMTAAAPASGGCSAEHAAMGHCSMPEAAAKAEDHAGHGDHSAHADHSDHGAAADHSGHAMSGGDAHQGHGDADAHAGHSAHVAAAAADAHAGHGAAAAASDPNCAPEHAAMGHCTPKASGPALPQIGTNQAAGDASAPPPPSDWMADAVWGADAMAHSRHMMMVENGGQKYKFLRLDSEYVNRKGRDSAVWGAEFWYGGDINRVVVKSDGEVALGEGLEEADVQLLYSRAVDAYFNLQAGVRQDLAGDDKRSYATIGFEGLAPYWFEVEGAAFLSDRGDLTAHFEAEYDQRITQKLVLQPAFEVGLSAQNIAEKGEGSGLTDVSAGLRLRYEIVRAFAPYVGVEWGRKFGGTARYARAAGEKVEATNFVFGIRAWF